MTRLAPPRKEVPARPQRAVDDSVDNLAADGQPELMGQPDFGRHSGLMGEPDYGEHSGLLG